MKEDGAAPTRGERIEERGSLLTDVVVPLAQSGVGGAVGALVGNHLSKPKEPPPPPPPAKE